MSYKLKQNMQPMQKEAHSVVPKDVLDLLWWLGYPVS